MIVDDAQKVIYRKATIALGNKMSKTKGPDTLDEYLHQIGAMFVGQIIHPMNGYDEMINSTAEIAILLLAVEHINANRHHRDQEGNCTVETDTIAMLSQDNKEESQ